MKIQIGENACFVSKIAREPHEVVEVSEQEARLLIGMRKATKYVAPEVKEPAVEEPKEKARDGRKKKGE